jgi:hypothetical protein
MRPLIVTPFSCHQISNNVKEKVTITNNPYTPKPSQKNRTLFWHKWEKPKDSLDESRKSPFSQPTQSSTY